ncbi:Sulfur reduction protein DsrS [Gammaproteobacteria bacterium]
MDLTDEDNLRLNVLLATRPQAVRIDEATLTVWGLTERGDARISLNPNDRPERYVRRVREFLSGRVLGFPGGYPVFIRRWTRMGQQREEGLANLLLLGEPEAVVAVSGAAGLSDELARRAWWAFEDAGNARRMLAHSAVANGRMGTRLANFLLEHLPFETDPAAMTETVQRILQPGLIDEGKRQALWRRAQSQPALLLGFLVAIPDSLPEPLPPRLDIDWAALDALNHPAACLLRRLYGASGQTFLAACRRILDKPQDLESLTRLFSLLVAFCQPLRPEGAAETDWKTLEQEAADFAHSCPSPDSAWETWSADVTTARVLSGLSYAVLRPHLGDASATAGLLRRKLRPVLDPLSLRVGNLLRVESGLR